MKAPAFMVGKCNYCLMDAIEKNWLCLGLSRFLSGIAMASSFGNHTVLPRRVMGFFDSLWDSLRFCFLVEKFPAFLRGGAWLNVMGILSSWLLWCINIDSWNTPCAIGCICYRKMGDVQQLPCLWTGLYHCFRCLTLYFLTLSTDPMCPPEQKDLFIGSSWQWISSESNKYQPKYILKLENHPKKKTIHQTRIFRASKDYCPRKESAIWNM